MKIKIVYKQQKNYVNHFLLKKCIYMDLKILNTLIVTRRKNQSLSPNLYLSPKKKWTKNQRFFFLLGKNRNVARDACRNKRTKAPAKWQIAWAHGHIMAKSCQ